MILVCLQSHFEKIDVRNLIREAKFSLSAIPLEFDVMINLQPTRSREFVASFVDPLVCYPF